MSRRLIKDLDSSAVEAPQGSTKKAAWSRAEFAKALGLTQQTIWRLPKKLKPETVRIGGRAVIKVTDAARIRAAGARSLRELEQKDPALFVPRPGQTLTQRRQDLRSKRTKVMKALP